jgi:hypothetical protein
VPAALRCRWVDMSLSTTTGSAERLHRAAGAWRLEFEQLVYNAPALLRPRRFAVSGEHAILQQLRELGSHEPLAKDAERLFARGAVPDGTYIARNGRWLPELRPDAVEPEPEAAATSAAPADSSQVEELDRRIASLEISVRALQKLVEGAMRALSEGARAAPAPAPAAAPIPIAPPQPVMPHASAGAATGVGAGAVDPIAAAAAAIMTPRTEKPINLPTAAALTELVKSLAGADAILSPGERLDWVMQAAAGPVFSAPIHSNDGEDVGAMIMDLEVALRLAGALLMESEEMVLSLLEEKMMSEEMLDAASEVCNTLMSAFNKVSGNPHLRAGKLLRMDEAGASWLEHARKRDDYRHSHGGRMTMALR